MKVIPNCKTDCKGIPNMYYKGAVSTREKLYHRYEFLARKYAARIFNHSQISYDREDLIQEFKLKIWTSLKSYGKRWGCYRRGEDTKPVPLRYYLETACANKANDFIKHINRSGWIQSIEEINYDFGAEDDTTISPKENRFVLNDVDLLDGLEGIKRSVFSLFLRGYKMNHITRMLGKAVTSNFVSTVVNSQRSYLLSNYGSELFKIKTFYQSYRLTDDD